jgi:hypothetical protein
MPLGGLLSCLAHTHVEYVTSTENEVSEVRSRRVASILGGPVQDYVHVTVAVDHSAAVFDIVLQPDRNVGVQLLHQKIQRLP